MNQTLQKLRELAQESVLSAEDSIVQKREIFASCAELAAPLIQAFRDVENEFVRITVMRQIWPYDFDRRDDRVAGLLVNMIGPKEAPIGLKIAVPHGFLQFEVIMKPGSPPVYSCVRDTHGQRPLAMDFPSSEAWLEFFYKSIADLIEL
ncbi:hypothetical protein [Thiorhodococcus minor]|uniref:Uncharacterized protein n=1 Tax=Thiorhodococcus minor TaxID=57489 RepID=A0A6M0JZL9_9GAMM|nr:hypothetical protein [Thiorhodococcus minor]NEV62912.1 hypothetical protein [Thiorhodococcus minor]